MAHSQTSTEATSAVDGSKVEGNHSQVLRDSGVVAKDSASTSVTTSSTTGASSDTDYQYPEQKHAGKGSSFLFFSLIKTFLPASADSIFFTVGYGPNYKPPHTGPSISDKLGGGLEILKGKILHKPEIVEHGQLRKTGALEDIKKEKDQAEDVRTFLTSYRFFLK